MNWKETVLDAVKAIAPSLVSFIPGVGPVASKGLETILNGMKGGGETEDQLMERIGANPELLANLKIHAMNHELELEKENTKRLLVDNEAVSKRLETVNQTMRQESISHSSMQRSWRPFNGYMFGITLFCDYFVSQIVMACVDPKIFVWTHIPTAVYMLWTGLLGITATSRGLEKVTETKTQNGGQMNGLLDTIKTFASGAVGK